MEIRSSEQIIEAAKEGASALKYRAEKLSHNLHSVNAEDRATAEGLIAKWLEQADTLAALANNLQPIP